jgi:hypothetical protein
LYCSNVETFSLYKMLYIDSELQVTTSQAKITFFLHINIQYSRVGTVSFSSLVSQKTSSSRVPILVIEKQMVSVDYNRLGRVKD